MTNASPSTILGMPEILVLSGAPKGRYTAQVHITLSRLILFDPGRPAEPIVSFCVGKADIIVSRAFVFLGQRKVVVSRGNQVLVTFRPAGNGDFTTLLQQLRQAAGRHIDNYFIMGEEIGSGGFSTVVNAQRLGEDQSPGYAVKTIKLNEHADYDSAFRELHFYQSGLQHQNVLRTYDVFASAGEMHIVMPRMNMDLREWTNQLFHGRLPEAECAAVLRPVLRAICFLHRNGVVHRDVKPANVLLRTCAGNGPVVVLADFGGSAFEATCDGQSEGGLEGLFGTPGYMAPEVLSGEPYGKEVDLFSFGAMMAKLLTSKHMFDSQVSETSGSQVSGSSDLQVSGSSAGGECCYDFSIDWNDPCLRVLTPACKAALMGLLDIDPNRRWTAEQALESDFFSRPTDDSFTKMFSNVSGEPSSSSDGQTFCQSSKAVQTKASPEARRALWKCLFFAIPVAIPVVLLAALAVSRPRKC